MSSLSGYRIMWMLVMFDLPVQTKKQRYEATKFRNYLLDQGFQMAQYSVYYRMCGGKEYVEKHTKNIKNNLPSYGDVNIIALTDKQYENMTCFSCRVEKKSHGQEQLTLF